MDTSLSEEIYVYRIDKSDIIVGVSDNWMSFAEQNSSAKSCNPSNVVGSPLWAFIHDLETRHLCEIIVQRVRNNRQPVMFRF